MTELVIPSELATDPSISDSDIGKAVRELGTSKKRAKVTFDEIFDLATIYSVNRINQPMSQESQ